MKYQEFDIDNSLNSRSSSYREPTILTGMNRIYAALANPVTSSEAYVANMVNDLNAVNRNVMYTNMMFDGLDDRLRIAQRVAVAVNVSKDRGTEGFNQVAYLNPWEYAVEGKVGDFFKRVWEAIKTACRRVLSAIVNFIKWIGVQIQSIGVKKQGELYKAYKSNPKAGKKENLKATIQSIDWADKGTFEKLCTKFHGAYAKIARTGLVDEKVISFVAKTSWAQIQHNVDIQRKLITLAGAAAGAAAGLAGAGALTKKFGTYTAHEVPSTTLAIYDPNALRTLEDDTIPTYEVGSLPDNYKRNTAIGGGLGALAGGAIAAAAGHAADAHAAKTAGQYISQNGRTTAKQNVANRAVVQMAKAIASIAGAVDKSREDFLKQIFGEKTNTKNAHDAVYNAVSKSKNSETTKVSVAEIKKRTGDFAILSDEWLAKNVKQAVAGAHESLKKFAEYTKSIDNISKDFLKNLDESGNAFSSAMAKIANAHIRFKGFTETACLELESAALRYRNSAYKALKVYLSSGKVSED